MNVTIKNSAISVVCKAHFFETNMNVFKNLLKKNSIVNNQEYEIQLEN